MRALINMLPMPVLENGADGTFTDSKLHCYVAMSRITGCIQLSYFSNLALSKFMRWATFSFGAFNSAFIKGIVYVVCVRSYEQMRWVAARWIVTMMAHKKMRRNCDPRQFQSYPVRKRSFAIDVYSPVSLFISRMIPRPTHTVVSPCDFSPKTISNRFWNKFCPFSTCASLSLFRVWTRNVLLWKCSGIATHNHPGFLKKWMGRILLSKNRSCKLNGHARIYTAVLAEVK